MSFYTPELLEELNVLLRFDLATNQQGIKIHKDASTTVIEAASRLHAKGLLSQIDGGYLTPLGRDAAEHAQTLLSILTTSPGLGHTP
jgi:uncharacterized protein (TIGR02647 family)